MMSSVLRLAKSHVLAERTLAVVVGAPRVARFDLTSKNIFTNSRCNKEIRSLNEKVKVGKKMKYELLEGETSFGVISTKQKDLFPDMETPNRLFDGVPFKQLHIVNIKSTPNNTIMSFSDSEGRTVALHSAGMEGYKNAKKGTNIAAQQASITFGNRIREYGVNTVRIRVQGIGAGRMSSIKGLQMTGLNIVSITDDTRVPWQLKQRPRKQRRI